MQPRNDWRVYILRHADTVRKPPRELNPHGIEQAHRMGLALAQLEYRHMILYSPYARTSQTAEIIAEHVRATSVASFNILREYEAGEPFDEMVERGRLALKVACTLFRFNPIIISHREPIRAMVARIFDKNPKHLRAIAVPKTGGFVLDFGGSSQYINAEMY